MKSRRRIAFHEAYDHANYVITAGIHDLRNGAASFCVATILRTECPLWVKSSHMQCKTQYPLGPKADIRNAHSHVRHCSESENFAVRIKSNEQNIGHLSVVFSSPRLR
jgi:hypothetical protein